LNSNAYEQGYYFPLHGRFCVQAGEKALDKRLRSLPQWMDEKAIESGLSLSRVLQDALNSKFALTTLTQTAILNTNDNKR